MLSPVLVPVLVYEFEFPTLKSALQTLTGFLIYDWIEQPQKQEIIKEVLSLLEQKVLEPHSGKMP